MGSINVGNQLVYYRYRHELKANEFNKVERSLLKPGIYNGGYLSVASTSTVTLSTFTALFNSTGIDGDNKGIKVRTTTDITLTPTIAQPVIIATYTYLDAVANYADFSYRAVGDAPLTNEIVFGTATFTGPNITSIDYSLRTQGLFDELGNTHVDSLYVNDDIRDESNSYTLKYGITDNSQNADGSYEVKRLDDETGTHRSVSSFTATGTITLSGASHGIVIGDKIDVVNATNPNNNGIYLISNVVGAALTVDTTFKPVYATEAGGSATVAKWVSAKVLWDESASKWQAGLNDSFKDIITVWNPEVTYGLSDTVSISGVIFQSTTSGNINNNPTSWNTDYWTSSPEQHFATNFSIDQKEDTEDTEYDNQQQFQMVPFGFTEGFKAVDQDKTFMHSIDTICVPVTNSGEITFTGTWGNNDSASHKFGRAKYTLANTDYAEFDFFGVSVGISLYVDGPTGRGAIKSTLYAYENGGWVLKGNDKKFDSNSATAAFNACFLLYENLSIGRYKVKVELIGGSGGMYISYFYYTTYMNQRPITQYYYQVSATNDLDDVPPTTTLVTAASLLEQCGLSNTGAWDSSRMHSAAATLMTCEFRAYGSKFWANVFISGDKDCSISAYVDNVFMGISFNSLSYSGTANNSWFRLDDGTITEGWHDIKLVGTPVGGNYWVLSGWGYYSSSAVSTVCRSLICGKDSYAVGVDDTGWAFSGAGWAGVFNSSPSFLRRRNSTSANTDYATYTSPNNTNLKAIYLIHDINTDRGNYTVELGGIGQNKRYLNELTTTTTLKSHITLLYDSYKDGNLYNKEIRLTKIDGTNFDIEGLIFEIGDSIENNYIWCMPKWTRFNQGAYSYLAAVSNTYRLDVKGLKTDTSEGAKATIHSGFLFIASPATGLSWNSGINIKTDETITEVIAGQVSSPRDSLVIMLHTPVSNWEWVGGSAAPNIIQYANSNSIVNTWLKFIMHLKRAI